MNTKTKASATTLENSAFIWKSPLTWRLMRTPSSRLRLLPIAGYLHVRAMYQWTGDSAPPDFDQAAADTYVGKYILVGVTYLDHYGKEIERLQMHGVIESADTKGIKILLRGTRQGETWIMPPTLESISPAKPGKYTLHSTGEVIENPDLLSTWTVTKPIEH